MKISRSSFVYKTAYYFTDVDKRPLGNINGCSLLWKFVFSGLVYLILVPMAAILILASAAILLVHWSLGILFGNKLVHYRKVFPGEEWDTVALNYVWPANWKWVPIESWPRIFGWRILPVGVVGLVLMIGVTIVFVSLNWVVGGMAAQGDSSALIMLTGEIVIGIGILAAFQQSAIRQSSVGQLVSANMRSFKDRTCPIVRVVD